MAVQTQADIAVESGEHVVQFYEHESELLRAVVPYLAAAAVGGEVAIVIATEAHRRAFEGELQADGIDLVKAGDDGRFFSLDAATTMASFIADGKIDHEAFREVIGGLVRTASETGRPIRAYGEMVALLWDVGDVLAAIELETLWNDLAREVSFSLFCAYPAASVAGSEHAEALHQVCHLHSSVLHPTAEGVPEGAVDGSSETEVTADFPAEHDSPGRARRLVAKALRQWGHDDRLVEDATLVLSELATNAVVHAGSPFSVAVRVNDSVLHIAVRDATPLAATTRENGLVARTGHGLSLIDVLSTHWGVEGIPDGKVVWAKLPYQRPADTQFARTLAPK